MSQTQNVRAYAGWREEAQDSWDHFVTGCQAWFVIGGLIVSGAATLNAYTDTPKGMDVVGPIIQRNVEYHGQMWRFIGEGVVSIVEGVVDAQGSTAN